MVGALGSPRLGQPSLLARCAHRHVPDPLGCDRDLGCSAVQHPWPWPRPQQPGHAAQTLSPSPTKGPRWGLPVPPSLLYFLVGVPAVHSQCDVIYGATWGHGSLTQSHQDLQGSQSPFPGLPSWLFLGVELKCSQAPKGLRAPQSMKKRSATSDPGSLRLPRVPTHCRGHRSRSCTCPASPAW